MNNTTKNDPLSTTFMQRALFIFLSCIFVGIIGITAYQYYTGLQKEKAEILLTTLENITAPQERMVALQNIEQAIPQPMNTAVALEIANIALHSGSTKLAQEQYALVAQSSNSIRIIGILGEAHSLLQNKKALEAISLLKRIDKIVTPESAPIFFLTLAEAQEDAKLFKDALNTYKKIETSNANSFGYIQYKVQELSEK